MHIYLSSEINIGELKTVRISLNILPPPFKISLRIRYYILHFNILQYRGFKLNHNFIISPFKEL